VGYGLLFLLPAPGFAAEAIYLSPDTTVDFSGTIVADQEVVSDDQAGTISEISLGPIPESSDVDGYHRTLSGSDLFSLDTGSELAGATTVTAADVVRFDGETTTLEYDASAEGIPAGVIVDAITTLDSGNLLLSFDTTVHLGDDLTAGDEDLVRFEGSGIYTLFFDGSEQNVPEGLDLDGAAYRSEDDRLFLSFDGNGSFGEINFSDKDVLQFDRATSTFSIFYDGSALHAGWVGADLVAVAIAAPEPRTPAQLASVITALAWLAGRRSRVARRRG
jgi:hypothetical protein